MRIKDNSLNLYFSLFLKSHLKDTELIKIVFSCLILGAGNKFVVVFFLCVCLFYNLKYKFCELLWMNKYCFSTRRWKKDVGYSQSSYWENQTHFQNCPSWFSGLKKSQNGEFHTQDQPYCHRLQWKEENIYQSLRYISALVPAPLVETPACTDMLGYMFRNTNWETILIKSIWRS